MTDQPKNEAPRPTPATADRAALLQSFETLYGGATDADGQVELVRLKGHRIELLSPEDPETLAKEAATLGWKHDSYNLVNLLDAAHADDIRRRRGRGKESELRSVVAFVADVDIGPKGDHNYPTREQALEAIAAMPWPPSMIIMSGTGLHLYWIFHEPIDASTEELRKEIKRISKGWQQLLRMKLHPYELDKTYDLVRVLRPAGSINHKYGTVVKILSIDDNARYELDDFEQFLPEDIDRTPEEMTPERIAAIDAGSKGSRVEQARHFLTRTEPAIHGHSQQHRTFHIACELVQGFALTIAEALPLLIEWNKACTPPLTEISTPGNTCIGLNTSGRADSSSLSAVLTRSTHAPVLWSVIATQSMPARM